MAKKITALEKDALAVLTLLWKDHRAFEPRSKKAYCPPHNVSLLAMKRKNWWGIQRFLYDTGFLVYQETPKRVKAVFTDKARQLFKNASGI